jgi:nitrite reductase (NO-forming)
MNSVMPSLGLSDEDVANALTYVYNQWNNAGYDVTAAEVKAVRDAPAPAAPAVR